MKKWAEGLLKALIGTLAGTGAFCTHPPAAMFSQNPELEALLWGTKLCSQGTRPRCACVSPVGWATLQQALLAPGALRGPF